MRIETIALAVSAALLAVVTAAHAAPHQLSLHPGLTVDFSIYGGYTSSGQPLGDYEFVNRVTSVSGGGYTYDFWFTNKASLSGSMSVSAEDKRNAPGVREYYGSGDMTERGYTGFLAVSDKVFADVKAGREARLAFDGPESPKSVRKVGEEDLTTLVNEHPAVVHTIKVKGAMGGTFWILDNAALPMVVKGETKWKWMVTAISDSGTAGAQVVSALKQTGEATTHSILFAFNSADLDSEAKPVLDSIVQYLKANPKIRLEVQGHTDNIGGATFNLALSQKRADAVKAYFVATGINAGRFTAKGYGLSEPVADNATPEGRARNRRVVFKVI